MEVHLEFYDLEIITENQNKSLRTNLLLVPVNNFHPTDVSPKLSWNINIMDAISQTIVVPAVNDEILSVIKILGLKVYALQLPISFYEGRVT